MKNEDVIECNSGKTEAGDIVSKRFTISQESYKKLKIKAIELEFDEDGKITPTILGKTIDAIIAENEKENRK
jgi:hypothetical protein